VRLDRPGTSGLSGGLIPGFEEDMSFATWLAFVAASAVMLLIPGPTVLMVVSYALTQGRRVALAMAAGVALGDFTAMTLSLAGLGALLLTSATLFTLLKWIGAAYLVYLGIKLWRAEPHMPDVSEAATAARGVFLHAFAVTTLNPKSIAFFVAFVPQFIDHQAVLLPQLVIIEATFVGLALLNALGFALAADRLRGRIRQRRTLKWFNRAGGSCLVGIGAATASISRNA
jgi:threonine/homoserine/homoserine lactone efflux protein